jgi:hypothetical protein
LRLAIITEEGDLVEITTPKTKLITVAEKQSWYSQLRHIGQARGYRSGWADNQYKHKFGEWPRGLNGMTAEPTGEVLNYVRSRQIAFAKRRVA